ncbi:MAG: hypothetical protein QXO21_05405 [Candidatus Anstonellales archaeon]
MEFSSVFSFTGKRPILLGEEVGYYYEKTRPPTEEEIKKRIEWFDSEWEKLIEKEPEFEKAISSGEKKFKEELSKRPPPSTLKNFFEHAFKLIRLIAKEGAEIAKPLARDYFKKAPVVTEAGFLINKPDGIVYSLKIDYKEEEWKRMPSSGVYPVSDPEGNYLALLTENEFGYIKVFSVKEKKLEPLFSVEGSTPFTFSPSGLYFAYATIDRSFIVITDNAGNVVRKVKVPEGGGSISISLTEKKLAIVNWEGVKVVNLDNGIEKNIHLKGGKSVLFNKIGNKLFVTRMPGELYIYDMQTLELINKLDYFSLKNKHKVFFTFLVSLSPDERFLAGVYDKGLFMSGMTVGESILFIYDLKEGKVVYKIDGLEDVTGGFGGIFLPAFFSPKWNYLLIYKKGNKAELLRVKHQLEEDEYKKSCKVDQDCACGVDKQTGKCMYGNKEFIDTSKQCPDFCTGIHGNFRLKCISGKCTPVWKKENLSYSFSKEKVFQSMGTYLIVDTDKYQYDIYRYISYLESIRN